LDAKKTVLVTGATGFIGAHVCRLLLSSGYRVRALLRDRNKPLSGIAVNSDLEQCLGDLLDSDSLGRACKDVDVVVHLAGVAHANNIKRDDLFEVNAHGTELLLAAAVKQSVRKFILLSSSLASPDVNNITSYGESKRAAENLVLASHNLGRLDAVVLRPVNVYGKGMTGNIASLISLIAQRRIPPLPLVGTKISLIGVCDLAVAIRLAIELDQARGNTYLVTDGQQYHISDIEKAIYLAVGRKMSRWKPPRLLLYIAVVFVALVTKTLTIFRINRPPLFRGVSKRTYQNLVNDNLFDNFEIVNELGFEPKSSFYDALPDIVGAVNHRS
jgi:nucleoside-diphosphate-sugar epimerase